MTNTQEVVLKLVAKRIISGGDNQARIADITHDLQARVGYTMEDAQAIVRNMEKNELIELFNRDNSTRASLTKKACDMIRSLRKVGA